MITRVVRSACGLLALCVLAACVDPSEPGVLVPATADEDPRLPRLQLEFGERAWWLHVQSFGDPEDPPVFVLPGGPGADFRLLLPLRALAQDHFVVMYDEHGAGLSRRTFEDRYPDRAAVRGPEDGWYAPAAQRGRLGLFVDRRLGAQWALQLALGSLFALQRQGLFVGFNVAQLPLYLELAARYAW